MWKRQNYKSELCENYIKNGFCPFYDYCKFAHGKDDLKEKKKIQCRYGLKCKWRKNCNMGHTPLDFEFWDFLEQKEQSKNVDLPPKYIEFENLPLPPKFLLEEEEPLENIFPPPAEFLLCDEKPKKKPKFVVKPKSITIKQQLLDIEKKQMDNYPKTKFKYFKDIAHKVDDGVDVSKYTKSNRFNKSVIFQTKCCGSHLKLNYGFNNSKDNLNFEPHNFDCIKFCCK